MQDLTATDTKSQRSTYSKFLGNTNDSTTKDALHFEIKKREELLSRLLTESEMLERDSIVPDQHRQIKDLEKKIEELEIKTELEINDQKILKNALHRSSMTASIWKMRANDLYNKEKKIAVKMNGAELIVDDISSTCNQEKAKVKYLNDHLELARTTRTAQMEARITDAKSLKSELEPDLKKHEKSSKNLDLFVHKERMKSVYSKLCKLDKETVSRKEENENKVETINKMYKITEANSLDKALQEYEKVIGMNASLSQQADSILNEIKYSELKKKEIFIEKAQLLSLENIDPRLDLEKKMELLNDEAYIEYHQALTDSKFIEKNFQSLYALLVHLYEGVLLVTKKINKTSINKISDQTIIETPTPNTQKEYEEELKKLLEYVSTQISAAENHVLSSATKSKASRSFNPKVKIENGHPYVNIEISVPRREYSETPKSLTSTFKNSSHFLRQDLMNRQSSVVDMILGAEDIERNAIKSVKNRLKLNEKAEIFDTNNDEKNSDYDEDADQDKEDENLLSPISENFTREFDEITGINNINKKLQTITAKAHQFRKVLSNEKESLRTLSLELAKKRIKLARERQKIHSTVTTPKIKHIKNLELPPLQKEKRLSSTSSAKTVPSTPSKRSPSSSTKSIIMPDYIGRIKAIYEL